jgi:hypothetical protein
MELTIVGLRQQGDLSQERIVIKATEPCDIGDYLVIASPLATEGGLTGHVDFAHWLADKKVAAGDLVVLYTKTGTNKQKKTGGATVHFFYWGLGEPVWGSNKRVPVLLKSDEWETYDANEIDSEPESEL